MLTKMLVQSSHSCCLIWARPCLGYVPWTRPPLTRVDRLGHWTLWPQLSRTAAGAETGCRDLSMLPFADAPAEVARCLVSISYLPTSLISCSLM